jgi:hypothetical protein
MDSIPWVHHSREEGSLDYDGRLVRLQVQTNFDTTINHQQLASQTCMPALTCFLANLLSAFDCLFSDDEDS